MRQKLDDGVMLASGSPSGVTYLMFCAERVDPPDDLDIQPFGIAVFSSGASIGMALILHGGWPDRTTPLPNDFRSIACSSSTRSFFFAKPPEGKTIGSLDELRLGHKLALVRIVAILSGSTSGGV
jgi:hypothetical protein